MKFVKILMISAAFAVAFAKNCVRPTKPCYVGGCSGQVCSAEKDVITPCIWEPSFACYQDATCERQSNGECGWTQTDALQECLDEAGNGGTVPLPGPCYVGGCSGEICSEEEGASSICIWNPQFACYKDAVCERQAGGQCSWTQTDALQECIDNAAEEETAPEAETPCYVGGCSGEICSEEEGASSICTWNPEFVCYKDAVCERQADGQCGWTQTEALQECIDNAATEEAVASEEAAVDPVV